MRRNATLSLEGFDPDVLDAARDVARRAGVPLETWIASVVEREPKTPRRRRRDAQPSARQAKAGDAAAEHAGAQTPDAPTGTAESAAPAPDTVTASIAAMMERLDALDRSITEERRASQDVVARTVEEVDRRIGELSAQLAGPLPLGRRGRPIVAEVREAVDEIRKRQRELDAESRGEPAALPPLDDLRRETSRLRAALGKLPTLRDLEGLEQSSRALIGDVLEARQPADVTAAAAPLGPMRARAERLVTRLSEQSQDELSHEVERLADHIDDALANAQAQTADRAALAALMHEIDDIRTLLAGLAHPARARGIAGVLRAAGEPIARLQGGVAEHDSERAEILARLETIRDGIGRHAPSAGPEKASGASQDNPVGAMIGRLEQAGRTLRRRQEADKAGDDAGSVQGMLRSLAEKVDRVGTSPAGGNLDALESQVVALAQRFDARGTDPALANLQRVMNDLLGQVTTLRDATAIEAAVERATRSAIAQSIAPDPGKVDLLRADLFELRAQQAIADQRMQATMDNLSATLERLVDRLGAPGGQDGPTRAGKTEDRPSPSVALRQSTSAAIPPSAPSTTDEAAQSRPPIRRPEITRGQDAARGQSATGKEPARSPEPVRASDELLEPGAGRPVTERRVAREDEQTRSAAADIKTNFIAAARRAAQAAQADLAAEASAAPENRPGVAERRNAGRNADKGGSAEAGATESSSALSRLQTRLSKHRRPLLLSLAALVLMLGALQAYKMSPGNAPVSPPVAKIEGASPSGMPDTDTTAATASPASLPDPKTTQSVAVSAPPSATDIAPPGAAKPDASKPDAGRPEPREPGRNAVPHVSGTGTLGADLAGLPEGLSDLRRATLQGEGSAIWELAGRVADGRGTTRDLGLAAKLYEKLGSTGYAPAQFKLGSFYEKGSGVTRDLAQAKVWYGRAAELGNIRAMHNLAVIHAGNPAENGKPDFATASAWFRRAAEHGVRDSQYNLAVLYARGLGLNQDLVQSYAWFSLAAAQGDEEAGRKRDDVAMKLAPKDLAAAKSVVSAYRPKPSDPAVNEAPSAGKVVAPPMTLLGAPPPGAAPKSRPGETGA